LAFLTPWGFFCVSVMKRNGKSAKTLKGNFGTLQLEVSRDRNGTFEPRIIEKHQTRFTGFDDLGI
jgi:transposase-like protein